MQLLPTQLRGLFRGQFLPALALALTAIAWIGLSPWRPILSGDDFGFYDSVVRTITEGRPIVSDWLAPATVGLTVPAASMTWLVGDLWVGSMAIMGIFGLLGLAALWFLLRGLEIQPARIALAILILGFFPIYLGKWTRFESCLPSVSLLLTALALIVRVFRPGSRPARQAWLYSLAAGLCIAWAITIRQNHIIVVLACSLGLLVLPSLRQPLRKRVLLLISFVLPTVIAFIALRLGVPLSFAQRTATLYMVSAHFSVLGYLAALLRAVSFASGMAALMALMIAPRTIIGIVQRMTRLSWVIGLASIGALLLYAAQRPGWLAPDTDILALLLVRQNLLIAIVLLGSLCWWPIVTSTLRSADPWISGGLLLMVAGYLVLVAIWGYWEYYLLEPILLLVIGLLMHASDTANRATIGSGQPGRQHRPRASRMAWVAIVAIYVLLSWNMQLMSNDAQATQLQVIEHAFRDQIAIPADTDQAPFGLLGWSLFPYQVSHWSDSRQGFSLAFWELQSRDPAVAFRWGCADSGIEHARDRILRSGTAQLGWQQQCWSLVRHVGNARTITAITDYRYLPLTSLEWQQLLAGDTNRQGLSVFKTSRMG